MHRLGPGGGWPRYRRDLEGAWHAIDDLREALGTPAELEEQRRMIEASQRAEQREGWTLGLFQRLVVGAFSLVMAAGAVASLILAVKHGR